MSLVDDLIVVQVVIYTSLVLMVMYSYIALAISPICYQGAVHKNYSYPQISKQYDQTNWVCVRVTTTTFNAIHIFFFLLSMQKRFSNTNSLRCSQQKRSWLSKTCSLKRTKGRHWQKINWYGSPNYLRHVFLVCLFVFVFGC